MKYTTLIRKQSSKSLNVQVMRQQLAHITQRMLDGGRDRVWSCKYGVPEQKVEGESYLYEAKVTLKRIGKATSRETMHEQIGRMIQIGQSAANASAWQFIETSGRKPAELAANEQWVRENSFIATICPNNGAALQVRRDEPTTGAYNHEFFAHIFERDAQIQIVQSAIDAYMASNYNNRFHVVLYGEPACGKTEILRSFTKMLGRNNVLELDATSTTKAGAERLLLESADEPPICVCEEIEKAEEHALRWMLGVLDHRGEVRKLTHGQGLRQREVKKLCLATVNDMSLFNRLMDGALASRFSHKVYCPRPSKSVLEKILQREVEKINGSPEWIRPAIDWCVDEEKTNDPRRVTTVCLSGREKLLTGDYQKLLRQVQKPKDE